MPFFTKVQPQKRTFLRKIICVALALLLFCAAVVAAFAGYRAFSKAEHRIFHPGIDEAVYADIGGIKQWLYIRGENTDNPVLLVIHGGPGQPISPALHLFQHDWESRFTVVQWDQRLSGKTFFANDIDDALQAASFEQSCADALEVIRYLKQRLDRQRIIVMGHSWGSAIGLWLAAEHPDELSAYIGVGQAVNLYENERLGYEVALGAAKLAENQADIEALTTLEPYPVRPYQPAAYYGTVGKLRRIQQKYGLYVPPSAIITDLGALTSPYYSLKELSYFNRSDIAILHMEENRYLMEEYDARNFGLSYNIPVFFIHGERDVITAASLVQNFYEEISAPVKRMFLMQSVSHVPMTERPNEFADILLSEILPLIGE